MPHFGLMDESAMSREDALLMRARLHLRSGRRLLREGRKTADAIATLYDALMSAMQWHILTSAELRGKIGGGVKPGIEDEEAVCALLGRAGILRGFDLQRLQTLVEEALLCQGEMTVDYDRMMGPLEAILTRLGVLPFAEEGLPPEPPVEE